MASSGNQIRVGQSKSPKTIVIAATFSAEPLEESFEFWQHEMFVSFEFKFAPYTQVFQQLLDPLSLFAKNINGLNVILLRVEDWARNDNKTILDLSDNDKKRLTKTANDFISALESTLHRSSTPYLICFCAGSTLAPGTITEEPYFRKMEDFIISKLEKIDNVYIKKSSEVINLYSVQSYYDSSSDELGHIPYTREYYTAIGTMIVRKLHAIVSSQYKVIVLDCDNTMWNGICGEDGPEGIKIDPPWVKFQHFMVDQINTGKIICLCSKNQEEDVMAIFQHHPSMPLKRDQIVSWRINWKPKSQNLVSLANELQLGLDSFIFIDDNPIECEEVRANAPEVLTLLLPSNPVDFERFLQHIWAFDCLKITEEDKKRTKLYQQEKEREYYRRKSYTLKNFIDGLDLKINITNATAQFFKRIAQLTERTNQFNFTTIRRTEAEIGDLCKGNIIKCLQVDVSDRFGDYGLVGTIIYNVELSAIRVDTFLLSCRVLGRGVEHRMLSRLGEIAHEKGLKSVEITYIPTKKNMPAKNFLDSIGNQYKESLNSNELFKFPPEYLKDLKHMVRQATSSENAEMNEKQAAQSKMSNGEIDLVRLKNIKYNYIGNALYNAYEIARIIQSKQIKERSGAVYEYVAPGDDIEKNISQIWEEVLAIKKIGIQDKFADIGGNSITAIRIISRIKKELGARISVNHMLGGTTVANISNLIKMMKLVQKKEVLTNSSLDDENEVVEL